MSNPGDASCVRFNDAPIRVLKRLESPFFQEEEDTWPEVNAGERALGGALGGQQGTVRDERLGQKVAEVGDR
jgi:hypothetical protein